MTSEQFHQTDSRDIVLYPSKGKLLLGSAFRLVLVIIGIGIICIGIIYIGYHQRTISLGIFAMAFGILASGIFTVAFGCLGLIYALYRLFASAPVLVINNEGIKSSVIGVTQMVKWEEIDAIYLRRIGTDTWFEVTLSAKGAHGYALATIFRIGVLNTFYSEFLNRLFFVLNEKQRGLYICRMCQPRCFSFKTFVLWRKPS